MKLLSLSGFIPEQICDVVRFSGYEGNQKISHYCGYVSDYIAQVMEDNKIDGAVYPRSCDSSRVISSYLQECGKFCYQFPVPARRDEMAIQYLAGEIQQYQKALEHHFGVVIKDVEERARAVDTRNQQIKDIYEHIEDISYGCYLRNIHELLQKSLWEQTMGTEFEKKRDNGKRVYLVGSFLANYKVADKIEEAGLNIVGDNLTESKRLFSAPAVECGENIYESIAGSILGNRLSPTQNNFSALLERDFEEIAKKAVQGVVFVTQKYCEPYEYLFSVYKKRLEEEGIPALRITLTDSTDVRLMEAALESFADML